MSESTKPVRGVLVDIAGVLYVGDKPLSGSVEGLKRLRETGLALRFVTNTTRRTRAELLARLIDQGFHIHREEVFSAPIAARQFIVSRKLRSYLLIHEGLKPEFADLPTEPPDAVLVGDAGDGFSYERMNEAFRVLLEGGVLVAMGDNRYFHDGDRFSLDMGPFVRALEYAAGTDAIVVGKPAPAFFETALGDIACSASETVMIGDDLASDVGGAQSVGIRGILVRTGKYRPEDERDETIHPAVVVDDFAAAVEWIAAAI